MFVQQWMTPSAADPSQQRVMMIMPVMFTFMFINFPAGLTLYWLVNNILTIAQQYAIDAHRGALTAPAGVEGSRMESVEAEGNSIDEAIERALQRLGVSRDKVDIEILSNATRGLFGFGGRRAKVRATLRRPLTVDAPAPAGRRRAAGRAAPTAPTPARRRHRAAGRPSAADRRRAARAARRRASQRRAPRADAAPGTGDVPPTTDDAHRARPRACSPRSCADRQRASRVARG